MFPQGVPYGTSKSTVVQVSGADSRGDMLAPPRNFTCGRWHCGAYMTHVLIALGRSVARVLPTLVLRSANLATQRPRLQRSSVQRSHCAPRPPTLVDNHARFRSASHATAFLPSRGRTCSSRSMTRRHVPPLPKLCRPTPIGTEATTSPSTVRVSSLWAQTLSASSARSSRCQPRSSRPSRCRDPHERLDARMVMRVTASQ